MRITYQKVFPLFLLIVLGVLVCWLDAASNFASIAGKRDSQAPDMTAFQVIGIRFNAQGQFSDRLISTQVSHYKNHNVTWFTAPVLEHVQPGSPNLIVSSRQAKLLQDTDELTMYEQVQAVREASTEHPMMTIATSNIVVDINKQTMYSLAPMRAVAGNSDIQALGFGFDNQTGVLTLRDQVKVRYVKEQ